MALLSRRGLGCALVAGLLTGCGFRPMYGRSGGGAALSSVDVEPIPEREGQLLRNALLDRFRPTGKTRHVLSATVRVSDASLGIQSNDEATLGRLTATAQWRLLTPTGDGRRRLDLQGTARNSVVYNILDNQYATERNRRAARADIADQLASEIETRLGAYFARPDYRMPGF
ncbi:LPS assembly lipoprotein LptE [Rhodospira trueperi]|uniref:LPS-assembly lipoprotein n=1 Tax=Rhodospira trueperi TaxID=69960 RepID=A0A1G7CC15_9PROT|nr:LPS assembly lipoprotein LptE [Rhodospira trueperi]SDE36849.1 LPS-assembly lipoprotein [Rhodospira trueperi]